MIFSLSGLVIVLAFIICNIKIEEKETNRKINDKRKYDIMDYISTIVSYIDSNSNYDAY